MKSYFISGFSQFDDGSRWFFWRLFEIDENASSTEALISKVKEFEESEANRVPHGNGWLTGTVIVTAFNPV